MEIIKRVCTNSDIEYSLEGRKLTLYQNIHYGDLHYPTFKEYFPQLNKLFLELTGYQIQELNLEVDENYDRSRGKLYSQLVIDLDKVDEVYKKYDISCITSDRTPEFILLGINLVKDYTGIEEENWRKDDSHYWSTSMDRKELHFYENELSFQYDGFDWECSENVNLTEDQINSIASRLGLTKECWILWSAPINSQKTVQCTDNKIIKLLIKDYLSGLTFDPDYESFLEEYNIDLNYSDFLFFLEEVKKDIAISKEMTERYQLSKSQRKLKDMVDSWITTTPRDFSLKDLTSTLIVNLETLVKYYERTKSKT